MGQVPIMPSELLADRSAASQSPVAWDAVPGEPGMAAGVLNDSRSATPNFQHSSSSGQPSVPFAVQRVKRAFDVVGSIVGLAFLWPLIGLLMIAVRLGSNGPAIFAQTRVGRGGRPFTLYKLRTMLVGTPDAATHQVSRDNVTTLGKVIRRWKLDE